MKSKRVSLAQTTVSVFKDGPELKDGPKLTPEVFDLWQSISVQFRHSPCMENRAAVFLPAISPQPEKRQVQCQNQNETETQRPVDGSKLCSSKVLFPSALNFWIESPTRSTVMQR